MNQTLHKIAHWLNLTRGRVVSATDDHGYIWIGFKCAKCGIVTGVFAYNNARTKPPPIAQFN